MTVPFICANFSPGLKGDLKNISVYMITHICKVEISIAGVLQPRAHMSTFSEMGKPENKSSYSGAR